MKWVWVGKYKVWLFNEEGRREIERGPFSLLILFPESEGDSNMSLGTEGVVTLFWIWRSFRAGIRVRQVGRREFDTIGT